MTIKNMAALTPILDLEKMPHTFYLTGSRFFRNVHEGSDWDFFTEDCKSIRESLTNNGFCPKFQNKYEKDKEVVEVWEKYVPEGTYQVQIVRDAEKKNKAQMLLNTEPVLTAFLKEEKVFRRAWWEWAYSVAGLLKD